MVLGVPDVHGSIPIDEHPVRPRQGAARRILLPAVSLRPGPSHDIDVARARLDPPDRVALGVGEVDVPVGCEGDALRPRQGCSNGGAPVAGVARTARPGDMAGETRLDRKSVV